MGRRPKVIDLFSGCGGLSYGLQEAGFDVLLGIDFWDDSLKTFAFNHKTSRTCLADLNVEKSAEILKKFNLKSGDIDLVVGGPPCQGFSISGKRMVNDPRNKLYKAFLSFVKELKPKAFLLENVPNLVSMGKGAIKNQIIEDFSNCGYDVKYKILLASDYGVPQNRRRVVFIGFLGKNNFEYPAPVSQDCRVTASDAIDDLPKDSLTDGSRYSSNPKSDYQIFIRNDSEGVYNHQVSEHTGQTIDIISRVPDGGNYKSLPLKLQHTRKVNIAWTRLNSQLPSFTIDTGHRHHFHYKYNRIPTVRESARIQSFPDKFRFIGTKTSQYKQVGNAVPPLLAYTLGKELLKYI